MRFLLIEDNQALANAVIERLSLDSHIVDHAADLTTAWDYTATAEYDLILLDIMLPDGDGRSFLEQHRSAKSRRFARLRTDLPSSRCPERAPQTPPAPQSNGH